MNKLIVGICTTLLLLAGCGNTSDTNNSSKEEVPEVLNAVLDIPENGELNEEIALVVTVTQGDAPVEDADEVEFEIWKAGQEDASEMVEAVHSENGKYSINHSFKENGLYTVQSHVTARDMHTMPKKTIQIGKEEDHHEHSEDATQESHHHHGDVSINLEKPGTIHVNEKTPLAVVLKKGEESLSDAQVRLEIFQQESNPTWVDMTEAADGEYKGEHQFPNKGIFTIRIHVKNDEGLHEHTEIEVTVE
ncbi:FixH family protein [Cytobacillus sp. FJAT-53684]|uniref:FixH family protein n=1 Tax=Cytobacillus mangrovibacter TaxID=3299024 RepID=A0ABW6K0W4_9BACI